MRRRCHAAAQKRGAPPADTLRDTRDTGPDSHRVGYALYAWRRRPFRAVESIPWWNVLSAYGVTCALPLMRPVWPAASPRRRPRRLRCRRCRPLRLRHRHLRRLPLCLPCLCTRAYLAGTISSSRCTSRSTASPSCDSCRHHSRSHRRGCMLARQVSDWLSPHRRLSMGVSCTSDVVSLLRRPRRFSSRPDHRSRKDPALRHTRAAACLPRVLATHGSHRCLSSATSTMCLYVARTPCRRWPRFILQPMLCCVSPARRPCTSHGAMCERRVATTRMRCSYRRRCARTGAPCRTARPSSMCPSRTTARAASLLRRPEWLLCP